MLQLLMMSKKTNKIKIKNKMMNQKVNKGSLNISKKKMMSKTFAVEF